MVPSQNLEFTLPLVYKFYKCCFVPNFPKFWHSISLYDAHLKHFGALRTYPRFWWPDFQKNLVPTFNDTVFHWCLIPQHFDTRISIDAQIIRKI